MVLLVLGGGFCIPAKAGNAVLLQLIQAVQTHPISQSQQALVAAAESGVDSARWQYFPTPSISYQRVSASAGDTTYGGGNTVTTVSLTQPVWTWGRLTAGMNKAEAQVVAAQAGRAEIQQQLAMRVVQSYGDWLAAYRKNAAYAQGVAEHQRLLDQVKRRVDEGQAAKSDFVLAGGRLAAIRAESKGTQAQQRVALARLGSLTGAAIDEALLVNDTADALSINLESSILLRRAEETSPTLARKRALAAVQEASVQETRARLLPEVQVRIEQQHGNLSAASSNGAEGVRAFLGIATQFGAGLSALSSLNEASGRYTAALAEIEAEQRNLAEQIITDRELLVDSAYRREALLDAVNSAGDIVRAWDRQYLSGRKSWPDLMNSARELVQTRNQLAELDAQLLIVSWRLALTTGLVDLAGAKLINGIQRHD